MTDTELDSTDDAEPNTNLVTTRRAVIGALGASGVFAAMSASGQSDSNVGIGGGPMSDELSHLTVRWYDGPESELPDPGVEGQRYFRVTEDGDTYNEGDVLVDDGDAWLLLDVGFGTASANEILLNDTGGT